MFTSDDEVSAFLTLLVVNVHIICEMVIRSSSPQLKQQQTLPMFDDGVGPSLLGSRQITAARDNVQHKGDKGCKGMCFCDMRPC